MQTALQTAERQIEIDSKLILDKNPASFRSKSIIAKFWLVSLISAVTLLLISASGRPVQAQQDEFVLHAFDDGSTVSDGALDGALTIGSDGNFYGTTSEGGDSGGGIFFTMTPTGQLTVLHSFGNKYSNGGRAPYGPVVEGADGYFYGTTSAAGSSHDGIVFKISSDGTKYTVLHVFGKVQNDGAFPKAGLTLGADGNFYGTTESGGKGYGGIIFQITPSGTETILHSFESPVPAGGYFPESLLVQGSDGSFYGTTINGGAGGAGTVFKITSSGSFTLLHSFMDGTVTKDGEDPFGPLAEGSDGNFYGTTLYGGSEGKGLAYKITPKGTVTKLHSFGDGTVPSDGLVPSSGLIAGQDGVFYGTTQQGGVGTDSFTGTGGTVFKITSAGTETILRSLNTPGSGDGYSPSGNLLLDGSGSLYGTTSYGSTAGVGSIFKLQVTPPDLHIANVLFYPTRSASNYANGLVSLTVPAPSSGYLVHLKGSPYSGVVPSIVNVPEGLTSASFPVQRVTAGSGVLITITAKAFGAGNKSATLLTP